MMISCPCADPPSTWREDLSKVGQDPRFAIPGQDVRYSLLYCGYLSIVDVINFENSQSRTIYTVTNLYTPTTIVDIIAFEKAETRSACIRCTRIRETQE